MAFLCFVVKSTNKLTIGIFSYERSLILNAIVGVLESFELPFDVLVADDSLAHNNYLTRLASNWKGLGTLRYIHNSVNLGHDRNLLSLFEQCDTPFLWVIGDSIQPTFDGVVEVLRLLEYDPDALILSSENRGVNKRCFSEYSELYVDFCWYVTLSGCLVYSLKNTSRFTVSKHINHFLNTNFLQLGLFFKSLALVDNFVVYSSDVECFFTRDGRKGSYWFRNIFDVFCRDWVLVNQRLSDNLTDDMLAKVLLSHDLNTNLFLSKSFFYILGKGFLKRADYLSHKEVISMSVLHPRFIFFLINIRYLFIPFAILVDLYLKFRR